jgi:hypothetical protein
MASLSITTRAPSALLAIIAASLIGTAPIVAALITSAPQVTK